MDINYNELRKTTLATVPEDQAFYVSRGDRIRTLKDLANCFEHLTEDEFRYHVNPSGPTNHPALWIRNTLHNTALANDLMLDVNLRDQKHFVKTIRDHLKWLGAPY
mgnify:CR=1 FL=1